MVVAPTRHLKRQWARAAGRVGLVLADEFHPRDGMPADTHGVVTTYQQVAADPAAFASRSRGRLVVLDEIHHAGADRSWGDALAHAFDQAAVRLALSGTPFRSDSSPIPFVDYVHDEARPDFTYGYADALADRVVRPVRFTRVGGTMEWVDTDGLHVAATFDDELDPVAASARLRTALDPAGSWLPEVLTDGHRRLVAQRRAAPDAGGLVLCRDQTHARQTAQLLRRVTGAKVVVAVSEDRDAAAKLAAFTAGDGDWLVSVRLVSEGVDIPRLTTLVWATTTTTELFFRQAVGRVVRARAGEQVTAEVLLPDDSRLAGCAVRMGSEVRHVLHAVDDSDADVRLGELDAAPRESDGQLSLFAPVAAETAGQQETSPQLAAAEVVGDGGAELEVALPPPPPLFAAKVPGLAPDATRSEQLAVLRRENTRLVRALVADTGRTHAEVNAELNRQVGIERAAGASVPQLLARLRAARAWLAL